MLFAAKRGVCPFFKKKTYEFTQKSPTFYLKSPTICQKSPTFSRGMLSAAKRGVCIIERAAHSPQRALHSFQRALHCAKWALHSKGVLFAAKRKCLRSCVFTRKEPCIVMYGLVLYCHTKEPCIVTQKSPVLSHKRALYCHRKEPYVFMYGLVTQKSSQTESCVICEWVCMSLWMSMHEYEWV